MKLYYGSNEFTLKDDILMEQTTSVLRSERRSGLPYLGTINIDCHPCPIFLYKGISSSRIERSDGVSRITFSAKKTDSGIVIEYLRARGAQIGTTEARQGDYDLCCCFLQKPCEEASEDYVLLDLITEYEAWMRMVVIKAEST